MLGVMISTVTVNRVRCAMSKIKGREKIKHAVVIAENRMMFLGKSHADCFFQMKNVGLKASKRSKDQGFFTNKGRYVDRLTAAKIAKRAKQLDPESKRKVTALLSEDIWYQTTRYIYTQSLGYTEILK